MNNLESFINKKVIVRTDDPLLFIGTLSSSSDDGNFVVLTDARKIFRWDSHYIERWAMYGPLKSDKCTISHVVNSIGVKGMRQILLCTDEAVKCFSEVPANNYLN